jgi:hypothetical protein
VILLLQAQTSGQETCSDSMNNEQTLLFNLNRNFHTEMSLLFVFKDEEEL